MNKPVTSIAAPVVESLYDRTEKTGIDENYRVIRGIAAIGGTLVALLCLGSLWAGHEAIWAILWDWGFLLVSLSLPLAVFLHQKGSRKLFVAESITSALLGLMFLVFTVRHINDHYEGDGKDAFLIIIPMMIMFFVKSLMALSRAAAFIDD